MNDVHSFSLCVIAVLTRNLLKTKRFRIKCVMTGFVFNPINLFNLAKIMVQDNEIAGQARNDEHRRDALQCVSTTPNFRLNFFYYLCTLYFRFCKHKDTIKKGDIYLPLFFTFFYRTVV